MRVPLVPLVLLVCVCAQGSGATSADDGAGYSEILAREPVDPPDLPSDDQPYTQCQLQILATEITDGETGPRLPVFLNYTNDGHDAHLHQFGQGAAVATGQAEATTFTSSINGLTLVATCLNHTVSSSSNNCMVLRNHDDLHGFLTRHHIKAPFGNQLAISTILRPYLDATRHVVLKPNERLALFELGTLDPENPAYDFQDLVVLVRLSDPKPFHRGDF